MAQYTSAEAAKLLRKLSDELDSIARREEQSREFLAALGEDIESARPAYNYAETRDKIEALEAKIRALKHAVNVFNTTTVVPETEMTVDRVLVLIPQLTKKCGKLWEMMNKLPKVRESAGGFGRNNTLVDYRYANYDIAEVERDYYKCKERLSRAQLQLDLVNSTLPIEIDDSIADC